MNVSQSLLHYLPLPLPTSRLCSVMLTKSNTSLLRSAARRRATSFDIGGLCANRIDQIEMLSTTLIGMNRAGKGAITYIALRRPPAPHTSSIAAVQIQWRQCTRPKC